MNYRILVIEDEPEIARLIDLHLSDFGCRVTLAESAEEGLAALDLAASGRVIPSSSAPDGEFDLVVLDLMLPGIDGLEACRRIRSRSHYIPILMLTARSSEFDRVLGLESGADDYLTKPFSVRELVARVKAILRRIEALRSEGEQEPSEALRIGELSVDRTRRTVQIGDQPIHLTAKEFDLLHHFADNPGRVYTRAQLLDRVWGYGHDGYEHTVNSHINRLRAKLETDPASPQFILTVWGVGYKFCEPESPIPETPRTAAPKPEAARR